MCSLPGVDTIEIAFSLLTFPGGRACQGSEHEEACQSHCLQYFHGRNLVGGDDLKVRPSFLSFLGFEDPA